MTDQSPLTRRRFLGQGGALAAGALLAPRLAGHDRLAPQEPRFAISLAGWSLHRRHFQEGKLPLIDFPKVAREEFDIEAIELVNSMFPSPLYATLQKVNRAAAQHRVKILLIMCDGEGNLSAAARDERLLAVRNHSRWMDIAEILGCHSIRINTGGAPGNQEDIQNAADSMRRLADHGLERNISVIAENHGGLSSHPESLARVMELANAGFGDLQPVGTLPDFGNFPAQTDRYAAIKAMMPWAKAVSAKCYDFDPGSGEETTIDFGRMLKIVTDAGYRGHVGIEYEGGRLSEHDGILAARDLLRRLD